MDASYQSQLAGIAGLQPAYRPIAAHRSPRAVEPVERSGLDPQAGGRFGQSEPPVLLLLRRSVQTFREVLDATDDVRFARQVTGLRADGDPKPTSGASAAAAEPASPAGNAVDVYA